MSPKNKNIPDQIIFIRKKINDFIDKAIKEDLNDAEILVRTKELSKMGDEVLDVLLSRLSDTNFENQNFVINALKQINSPDKIEALNKIIEDENRTDPEKVIASNLLQDLGQHQDFEYLSSKLHNPHQMFLQTIESVVNSLDRESALTEMFTKILLMPEKTQLSWIDNLKQFSGLRINRLFIPLLLYSFKSVKLVLLEHLKNYEVEEMLLPLRYLMEKNKDDDEILKPARMLYFRTQMKINNLPPDRVTNSDLDELYRCVVSNIDGDGGQIVSISRKKKSGKLKIFNAFFNDSQGIKDCLGIDSLNREEYDMMVSTMKFSGVTFNEVSLNFAKQCVETGFELSLKRKKSIPENFFIWHRHFYDECQIPQAERDYQNLDLDELAQNDELFNQSYNLLDLDEFDSWFIEIPQSRRKYYISLINKAKKKKSADRRKELEKIIYQAITDLVDTDFAQKIRHRLLRQAPLLFFSYGEEKCGWALAAAEKLKEDSDIQFYEHPFIREMMIIGISNFIEGI